MVETSHPFQPMRDKGTLRRADFGETRCGAPVTVMTTCADGLRGFVIDESDGQN
jgi:hypothetical protein